MPSQRLGDFTSNKQLAIRKRPAKRPLTLLLDAFRLAHAEFMMFAAVQSYRPGNSIELFSQTAATL